VVAQKVASMAVWMVALMADGMVVVLENETVYRLVELMED
jgi:hypothetical protein